MFFLFSPLYFAHTCEKFGCLHQAAREDVLVMERRSEQVCRWVIHEGQLQFSQEKTWEQPIALKTVPSHLHIYNKAWAISTPSRLCETVCASTNWISFSWPRHPISKAPWATSKRCDTEDVAHSQTVSRTWVHRGIMANSSAFNLIWVNRAILLLFHCISVAKHVCFGCSLDFSFSQGYSVRGLRQLTLSQNSTAVVQTCIEGERES